MKTTFPLIIVFFIATRALSTNYFVDTSQSDDIGDGTSWSTAKKTIQAAIDLTEDGDIVWVTNGVYELSQPINLSKSINIVGGSDPTQTIVDAKRKSRAITMTGPGATLSGMTIINGYHHINYPPTPTYGGGIYCDEGNHIITNCVISGNTVGYGGGGLYRGSVYDSIISDNKVASQNGGGLHSSTAYRCIIKNNMAGLRNGGGMYGGYAENCLIKGNDAALGGGVSEGTVVNCTIVNNHAGQYGGLEGSTARNSIILDNSSDFYYPNFGIQDSTVISSCSPSVYHGSSGNITNAPLFIDEVTGDYHLNPDSPCINAGNNTYITIGTDKDGKPRILDGTVDMGIYEFGSATIIIGYGPSSTGFEINWIPIVGYDSKVIFSTDLTSSFSNLSTILPYPANSYIDTAYGSKSKCYYKVELVPQP